MIIITKLYVMTIIKIVRTENANWLPQYPFPPFLVIETPNFSNRMTICNKSYLSRPPLQVVMATRLSYGH